ncbi:MAG: hypothetical protein KDK38_09640 [Leptospiraceae bacterium]|nr:hypothetical protein [Leptospiraceae bacterium]
MAKKVVSVEQFLNEQAAVFSVDSVQARLFKIIKEYWVKDGDWTARFMPDIEIIRHIENWSPYNSGWFAEIRPMRSHYDSFNSFMRAYRTIADKLWHEWPGELRIHKINDWSQSEMMGAFIQLGLTGNVKREMFTKQGTVPVSYGTFTGIYRNFEPYSILSLGWTRNAINSDFRIEFSDSVFKTVMEAEQQGKEKQKEAIETGISILKYAPAAALAALGLVLFSKVRSK